MSNVISLFESTLTRTIGIKENELSEDLFVLQAYFFDVLEDVITNGFMCRGEKYVVFTASAGQIRTKKTVFIKESVLKKHINSISCGLSIDKINSMGGVNINKYLAYLALSNSATDYWESFDITKSIVVNDFETLVDGVVDLIDDRTYEITRTQMQVPIEHTDGCGMMLSKANPKNTMVRLPWIKGLMVVFPYDKFIKEMQYKGIECGKVKDIYGKEYDILKDDIQYIFTKSQFKMHKYYKDWDEYKDNFIKYNCQAGKCNEEEDTFKKARLNYQMLQTLTDMTNDELKTITKKTRDDINNISCDYKTMLKVLGATSYNKNKNYIQQALTIYPELLNDTYSKEIIKQVKKSMMAKGRAGKIDIDGTYTFLIPDLYAFCEHLFLGENNPQGLLKDGEVFCKIYKSSEKLDCLRSPHLFLEHPVRKNVVDEEKSKWFVTNGIYTSCHDLISKTLQFDNDGDQCLVVADKTIISVAERNMKDIVPLYYNMATAKPSLVNSNTMYNGLITAYTGGNIGMISNDITKIWNGDDINLDVIKLLCCENNFTIDFAKTLYKPARPKDKDELITKYTKAKVPHFFIYAKNKTKNQVEPINNSVVNRLNKFIPNPRLKFTEDIGNFDYRNLMSNKDIDIDISMEEAKLIIDKYIELDLNKRFLLTNVGDKDIIDDTLYIYKDIRQQILEVNNDVNFVTDILIKHLYESHKGNYKTTLWFSFGDIIVENLKNNITLPYSSCEVCGKFIRKKSVNSNIKYCDECKKYIKNEQNKLYYHKNK